jgi:acyl carrier protein
MLDRPNLNNQIVELTREAMSERAPTGPLGLDDDLRRMGLASMSMVKLMMAVEVAFNISVPDEDLNPDNFRSIRAIESLVSRLAG